MTPEIDRAVEAQRDAVLAVASRAKTQEIAKQILSGKHVITPDHLRSLLEMEARQPREWTAETIKDAPEGLYHLGEGGFWMSRYFTRDDVVAYLSQSVYSRAFGPYPPPPAPDTGKEG